MKIVDVNLSIGKRDESGTLIDAEYIKNFMRNFCITHAVAYHEHSKTDPKDGITKMMKISEESEGKIGICAVLDPILGADNLPGDGNLIKRLSMVQAEAVRIFPSECRVPFQLFYWKEILDAAKECHLPIIIDGSYPSEFFWHLPEILSEYSENNFILIRQGVCQSRIIMPLLRKFKNVYFTVERMADYDSMEELAEEFDCQGLLFGSDHPTHRVEAELGLVLFADISHEQKERILFKNWEEMFR